MGTTTYDDELLGASDRGIPTIKNPLEETPITPELTTEEERDDVLEEILDFGEEWEPPEPTIILDPNDPDYLKVFDEDGNLLYDYSNLAPMLAQMGGYSEQYTDYQTWVDNMAERGINVGQGDISIYRDRMDELVQNMGNISEEEYQWASEYSAGLFGLTDAERDELLNMLQGNITGETEVEGYSDQERAIYQRQISRQTAEMAEYSQRMVNNIMASTGAMTPALAAADNYTNNISNYAIQAGTQLIEDEMAMKQSKIESQQRMWEYMVSQGTMGEQQYIDNMMQAQSLELQGYMASMNSVLQENQQHLDLYRADQDAITNAMNATYNGIMATLGVNEALTSQMQQYIENEITAAGVQMELLTAQLVALDAKLEDERLAAESAAAQTSGAWLGFGGVLVTSLGIILACTGVGAIIAPALVSGGLYMFGKGAEETINN